MAFKLSKKQADELNKLSIAFEEARSSLFSFLDETASEWEDEFSDKSERWQEGEAGQAAQEKIDLVRGWADEMPEEGTPSIDLSLLQ